MGMNPARFAPALRSVDANCNRAREALRVMEDAARFELDHQPLAGQIKDARHELSAIAQAIPGGALAMLAARDTPADVGATNKTSAELIRSTTRDVATAAAKRLTEALRTLEELLKLMPQAQGPTLASRVERLRYRAYELEKRLILALGTGRGVQWKLCVLITERLCARPWQDVALRAIAGGADCLQLREKTLGDTDLLNRARELVTIARATQRPEGTARPSVIVNDRPDIALLAGADGVHLGQGDLTVEAVRHLAGESLLVGVSTHDLGEAQRAAHDGADYTGVGAMFATGTKPRDTSGPAYLRDYLNTPGLARIPHLAIGGITPENVGEVARVGGLGVAVSSVVCASSDPAEVCRALLRGLRSH